MVSTDSQLSALEAAVATECPAEEWFAGVKKVTDELKSCEESRTQFWSCIIAMLARQEKQLHSFSKLPAAARESQVQSAMATLRGYLEYSVTLQKDFELTQAAEAVRIDVMHGPCMCPDGTPRH
jgi:hypothetical protein